MNYGAVILAGGKSTRMGTPKHQLELDGVRFLDRLVSELGGFQELLVSVDEEQNFPELHCRMVSDVTPGCGPLGGLYAALNACTSDALVAVPCDVPLFSKALAEQLCTALEEEIDKEKIDAVVMVTEDGKRHPLCGIYKKSCREVFRQSLDRKEYRVRDALAKLRIKVCPAGRESWRLFNVNTPQAYDRLKQEFLAGGCRDEAALSLRPPEDCIAVCGWKNAGKTTLIEKLIPLLTKEGLKVAVIKHDGHSYQPDVPGTDSFRFFQAGAYLSAVYDEENYSLTRRAHITDRDVSRLAAGADLVLLEGLKGSGYPKLEVVRRENRKPPLSGLKGRLAYVSDMEAGEFSAEADVPVFGLSDTEKIAAFIIEAYRRGKLKERWKHEGDQ